MQEDLVLYRALDQVREGRYIDVGAHHPAIDSVTKLFYDRGWSGINIEPVPHGFDALVKERSRDVNLQVAAGASHGQTTFHEVLNSGLSTTVEQYASGHRQAGHECRTYDVATRRLDEICDEHITGEIHFLKIDVEGAERAVLEGCDFSRHRPWIVVIEATDPLTRSPAFSDWEEILIRAGYVMAATDGLNRYYAASEHRELIEKLRDAVKQCVAGPAGRLLLRFRRGVMFHISRLQTGVSGRT